MDDCWWQFLSDSGLCAAPNTQIYTFQPITMIMIMYDYKPPQHPDIHISTYHYDYDYDYV